MLKFFRRIRRKLLDKGNLKKYLMYAFGEILLVVVGILIALQINNRNEVNKSIERQGNYLALIRTEMSNNLKALQLEEDRVSEQLLGLREFIVICDQPSSEVSEKILSATWAKVFSKTIKFKYENGAITELISSGVLKEIRNDSIRNMLASWEGEIAKVHGQENELNAYIQKGNDYLEQYGSVRNIIDENNGNAWWRFEKLSTARSNKFLLDSKEFENIVVFAIGTGQTLESRYKDTEQQIEHLIQKLDAELN